MSEDVLIRLKVLGPPSIEGTKRDASESLLASPKLVGLLTYLAMPTPGTLHQRDTVLGRFWPEMEQARAQASLRKALYRLRRSVNGDGNSDSGPNSDNGENGVGGNGPILKHGDGLIGADPDFVWCDVAAFEQAVSNEDHSHAIDLYRGDLLEGLYLPGLAEFERWLEGERARLRHKAVLTAWARAEVEEAVSNWGDAAFWARRAAGLAPDDETVFQRLIEFLDHVGDRAGALREYDNFSRYLNKEFDAEPSAETQELIEKVRKRIEANRDSAGLPPALPTIDQNVALDGPADPPAATVQEAMAPVHAPVSKTLRGRRKLGIVVACLAVAAGVLTVVGVFGPFGSDNNRVLVTVFDNRTADSTLDRLGQMAAHWISRGLAWDAVVPVVSHEASLFTVPDVEMLSAEEHAPVVVQALAEDTEAGTAVWGAFYAERDSIRFEAMVSNTERRSILHRLEPITVSRAHVLDGVDRIRERVVSVLAARIDGRLSRRGTLPERPPRYDAYDAFIGGLNALFVELHGWKARERFKHSYAADSSFDNPAIMLSLLFMLAKQYDQADSVMRDMDLYKERPAYDRLMLRWIQTEGDGDRLGAYDALKDLVELVPEETFLVYKFPARAREAGQYQEVVEILERSYDPNEPDAGVARELAGFLGFLGQYERQLQVLRSAREDRAPTLWEMSHELQPLAALGRVDELYALLDTALTQPDGVRTPGQLYAEAGNGLLMHGFEDEGYGFLDSAIVLLQRIPPDVLDQTHYGMTLAETLYLVGRFDEAEVILRDKAAWGEELPDSASGVAKQLTYVWAIGQLGKIAAHQGRRADALDAARLIEQKSNASLRGNDLWYRAGITAVLGQREETVVLLREALAAGLTPGWFQTPYMLDFEGLQGYEPFERLIRQ